MPTVIRAVAVDLGGVRLTARNILAESQRPESCDEPVTIPSQEVQYAAIPLRAGMTVAKIGALIHVASATVTTRKVGLYDKNGNRLAISANDTSNTNTVSWYELALTAAYVVPTSDLYYAAWLENATTPSQLRGRSSPSGVNWLAPPGGVKLCHLQAAQTDLPATAMFANSGSLVYLAAVA